jgi:hypothetical protein
MAKTTDKEIKKVIAEWEKQFIKENPDCLLNGYNKVHLLEWVAKKFIPKI